MKHFGFIKQQNHCSGIALPRLNKAQPKTELITNILKTKTMKTLLKISALLLVLLGLQTITFANGNSHSPIIQGDSIIVNFGEGGKMVIVLNDKEDLEELKAVDFNKIIEQMSAYIDSAKNSSDGTYTVTTEQGSFKIYTEDVDEDDDGISISIGDKGFYIGKTKNKDGWEEKQEQSRTKSFTDFYIGLNGYLEDGATPDGPYELRPFGSRYFEVVFKRETRLGKSTDSKLFLNYGLGFSWYNFMLDGNQRFVKQNDLIAFESILKPDNTEFTLKKTKLTASYVNIPLMFMYKDKGFRFGLGGYVGYRLGSHTKVKYLNEDGDWTKDKEFGNFNLTNFRYGLQTEIGVKGLQLFGKYDLNNLFTSNSGARDLNAFAFGIRL